ncbi:DNA polymerase III subunit beta [Peptococcaceae bacterium SCADC1_2_3]|nr:DNA polymerase III subunit beta [Peptococcaceae bacterium SCADC1_2_3]KFI35952.1 DNA polymerase III subunit beta [Peptococcaceae bacterium SCADC1_2_3]
MYRRHFQIILKNLTRAASCVYKDRLVTLAVFGSVGRNTPRPDSDIDLLLIADSLPPGRMKRMEEFYLVEEILTPLLEKKQKKGIYTSLSPVIKEKNEALQGSLLFLDLLDDVYLLYDKENFFENYLSTLKERLKDLGGKKIYRGGGWYWLLKEDYSPGEEFKL